MSDPFHFKHIVLVARPNIAGAAETLVALRDFLCGCGVEVCFEKSTATLLDKPIVPVYPAKKLPAACDCIIVVGGDGSLLSFAPLALQYQLPMIGVNRGRLGFLTDIHPNQIESVQSILEGHFQIEQRFLLSATVMRGEERLYSNLALNDVVLLPGDLAQMIEFDVRVAGQLMCTQRADGMIVATPTGSTAYALSGGGPILYPTVEAIVMVPMFPHTLSSRPVVIPAINDVVLTVTEDNEATPYVSCDGGERYPVPMGARVVIHRHDQHLSLIHPVDYHYFRTLREKLHWGKYAKRH